MITKALKKAAIKKLDKLRGQVLACYRGHEDVISNRNISDILDRIDNEKLIIDASMGK
jgi:hypothetical protein